MRQLPLLSALLGWAILLAAGCRSDTPDEPAVPASGGATGEQGHSHEGDDALVWVEQDIEQDGFVISLGHHGEHLHAATNIEPAIMITRDSGDVADAKVFHSLYAADGQELIHEEVATVYEPKTDEEPAHYAQGELHLPKGSPQFVIRYRIELPGVEDEFMRDVTIDVHE